MLPSLITDVNSHQQWTANQNSVFKHSVLPTQSSMDEMVKQDKILEKIMAFRPSRDSALCMFEEAQITAVNITDFSYSPTRKIDFITISQENVLLECVDACPYPSSCSGTYILPTYNKFIGFNVGQLSVCNHQAVIELLALNEV